MVVYEWLCGERPFEGSVSELIAQQLGMHPFPLRERGRRSSRGRALVLRALAKTRKRVLPRWLISPKHWSRPADVPSCRPRSLPANEFLGSVRLLEAGYETVAVYLDQPRPTNENVTPCVDLPRGSTRANSVFLPNSSRRTLASTHLPSERHSSWVKSWHPRLRLLVTLPLQPSPCSLSKKRRAST